MKLGLIAYQTRWNLDDPPLHRNAELLDQHDFMLRGNGQDAHSGIRLGAAHVIPSTAPIEGQPTGFE